MIEIRSLTKRFGPTVAVDDLTFTVRPGLVTGFLGPNGAGKTTTIRVALGLAAPTRGEVLLAGRPYAARRHPLREVGAVLDPGAVEGARSAIDHLGWIARSQRLDRHRPVELLEQVGLAEVARRPVGTFSLGMRQRLAVAAALLGDPGILLLDEPMNGLDPEGIRWMRRLMRSLAAEGRTVFVSSHLLAELAMGADRLVIVGRGRLLADTTVEALAGHGAAGAGSTGIARAANNEGVGDAERGGHGALALEDAYLALTDAHAGHHTKSEGRAR